MKQPTLLALAVSSLLMIPGIAEDPSASAQETPANTLTREEAAAGWTLLFNGKDLSQWRNYKKDAIAPQWEVKDDTFTLTSKGGGDIITKEIFGAFELKLDYKISPGGNSGIMYHVAETRSYPWQTGPEIQIQDNEAGRDPQKAGWLYQLYPAEEDATNPAGEWNTVHIIITPEKCAHYMNGKLYCTYVKGSVEWDEKVAKSKFAAFEGFGKETSGHIALQDHGDIVSFRNVKIRPLD